MLARCYLGMLDAKDDEVDESDESDESREGESEEDERDEEVAVAEQSDGRERNKATSTRGSRVASNTRESRLRDPNSDDLWEEVDALHVAEVEE